MRDSNILLINLPSFHYVYPMMLSLGPISIGSVLKPYYNNVTIKDFDLRARLQGWKCSDAKLKSMINEVLDANADLIGITTISNNLPLALFIADSVKKAKPDTKVLLGGPQATLTAREIIENMPCVDAVVCGEGERVALNVVKSLLGESSFCSDDSVVYRENGKVVETARKQLIVDLDELPLMDFSLVEELDKFENRKKDIGVSVEAGRGCPYSCNFCSSAILWERLYRKKTAARVLSEMNCVEDIFEASHISLVHDNFTVSADYVHEFCNLKLKSGATYSWNCSSRADALDNEMIKHMSAAGCNRLYFGIETGSKHQQVAIRKQLDLPLSLSTLSSVVANGIDAITSFIIGHVDETEEDINDTINVMLDMKQRGASIVQVHTLSVLNGTEVYNSVKDRLILNDLSSHMAFFESQGDVEYLHSLIARHPDLFPSYYTFEREGSIKTEDLHYIQDIGFILVNHFCLTALLLIKRGCVSSIDFILGFRNAVGKVGEKEEFVSQMRRYLRGLLERMPEDMRMYAEDVYNYEASIFLMIENNVMPRRIRRVASQITLEGNAYKLLRPALAHRFDFDMSKAINGERKQGESYMLFVEMDGSVEAYDVREDIYNVFSLLEQGEESDHSISEWSISDLLEANIIERLN